MDAIVDRGLWDDCGFETGHVLLTAISSMNHKHLPLLNYLMKKYEDKENKDNKENKNLHQLLLLFAYAVKVNCEASARILLEKLMREERTIKSSRKMLIYLTYYMSVLDYYDQGLLQALFSNIDFVTEKQLYKLKRLISTLKIFYPSCPVPEIPPNNSQLHQKAGNQSLQEIDQNSDDFNFNLEEKDKVFPLKSKLELIFGGPEYLLTNVKLAFRVPVGKFYFIILFYTKPFSG